MQLFSNSELSHVVTTVVVFTITKVIEIGLWLKKVGIQLKYSCDQCN